MKRRGFFGAFAGMVAAPIAAAAIKQTELVQPPPAPIKPLPAPMLGRTYMDYTGAATVVCSVSAPVNAEYDQMHNIVHCQYCGGREFADYTNCRHCGASIG